MPCVLIGLGAASLPRIAEACSIQCGLVIVRPAQGDPHPANAALQLVACNEYLDTVLSVTVDGVPASLVPAPEPADGRVAISPTPAPGQEVVLVQCGENATARCPDPPEPVEILRYVAGPDDLDAPPAAGTVTLGHTYGPSEVACMDTGDVEFHVELANLDQGAETAVAYVVVLDNGVPEGNSAPRRSQWVGPEGVASLAFDIGAHLESATLPPEDACVTVTAIDLAGHVTSIAETCGSVATNDPPSAGDESTGGDGSTSGGAEDTGVGETMDAPPNDATTSGFASTDTGNANADVDVADRGCACALVPWSAGDALGVFAFVMLVPRRRRS